jgi:hypothetical protein
MQQQDTNRRFLQISLVSGDFKNFGDKSHQTKVSLIITELGKPFLTRQKTTTVLWRKLKTAAHRALRSSIIMHQS